MKSTRIPRAVIDETRAMLRRYAIAASEDHILARSKWRWRRVILPSLSVDRLTARVVWGPGRWASLAIAGSRWVLP